MTDEQRQELLLLLLLALSQQTEKRIRRGLKPRFLQNMRRLRRLVQQLPETGFMRQVQWTELQGQTLPILEETSRRLVNLLLPELQQLIPEVQDAAFDYAGAEREGLTAELIPRKQEWLLTNIRGSMTGNQGVATLLALFGQGEGFSRFTLQSAKLLDQMVRTEILMDTPTQKIADKVVKLVQQRGSVSAVIKTGSFANLEWNRVNSLTAAAVWDATSKELTTTFLDSPNKGFIWNALLDPKTCPVCRPLEGMRKQAIDQFPYSPPVHPRCRCAILPLLN